MYTLKFNQTPKKPGFSITREKFSRFSINFISLYNLNIYTFCTNVNNSLNTLLYLNNYTCSYYKEINCDAFIKFPEYTTGTMEVDGIDTTLGKPASNASIPNAALENAPITKNDSSFSDNKDFGTLSNDISNSVDLETLQNEVLRPPNGEQESFDHISPEREEIQEPVHNANVESHLESNLNIIENQNNENLERDNELMESQSIVHLPSSIAESISEPTEADNTSKNDNESVYNESDTSESINVTSGISSDLSTVPLETPVVPESQQLESNLEQADSPAKSEVANDNENIIENISDKINLVSTNDNKSNINGGSTETLHENSSLTNAQDLQSEKEHSETVTENSSEHLPPSEESNTSEPLNTSIDSPVEKSPEQDPPESITEDTNVMTENVIENTDKEESEHVESESQIVETQPSEEKTESSQEDPSDPPEKDSNDSSQKDSNDSPQKDSNDSPQKDSNDSPQKDSNDPPQTEVLELDDEIPATEKESTSSDPINKDSEDSQPTTSDKTATNPLSDSASEEKEPSSSQPEPTENTTEERSTISAEIETVNTDTNDNEKGTEKASSGARGLI